MRLRSGKHLPAGRGQALVELAIVLPVLLVIMLGVVDFGRLVFAYDEVSNAAREGGRTAIVDQNPDEIRARAAAQAVALGIPAADPGTGPDACPTTSAGTESGGAPGSAVSAGICVGIVSAQDPSTDCSTSTYTIGCMAVVSVKYTFTPITPLIGSIVGSIPVESTTRQVIESMCTGSECTVP